MAILVVIKAQKLKMIDSAGYLLYQFLKRLFLGVV